MDEHADARCVRPKPAEITRLAPSPTGALHLGNLRTFLINWAIARQQGWHVILRIEDLDGPRVKPGAEDSVLRVFDWIGLDWDGKPLRQSDNLGPYRQAMHELAQHRLIFPCRLSRKEIEAAASAPHLGDHETRYPPELRPDEFPETFDDESTNWRLVVTDEEMEFEDAIRGRVRLNPARSVGDFVVWTRRGQPSYQLAVVVDDARQGVSEVVRGDDLLDSAGRQMLLYRLLGVESFPRYCHLPLVLGVDGKRLAKRHGDTRIETYIERGVPRERIIGLLGYLSGTVPTRSPMSLDEFLEMFDLATLRREPAVFTPADETWLLEGAI